MPPPNARRRRRRIIQNVNSENVENIPIITDADNAALDAELTPDGAARRILGELQENIARLVGEKRELNAELASRKRARTRSVRVIKESEDDYNVGDAARYFAVNKWCFVPYTSWLEEDPDDIPDDDTDLQPHIYPKKQVVLDYISVLPSTLKDKHQVFAIRSIFFTDLSNMRSQEVHKVKASAHKIFPSDLAKYIQTSRRSNSTIASAEAKSLLGFKARDTRDPDSKDSYSIKPKFILGHGGDSQAEKLFRVESLAKVARLLIFGAASLDGPSVANNETYGKMWGLDSVTAPLIAFSAVVVNYLLSSDPEFTPIGKSTHMEYNSRYARYRAWAGRLPMYAAGRETLKFWNDIVFAGYTRNNGRDVVEASDGNDIMDELFAVAAAEEAALALELELRNTRENGNDIETGATGA